MAAQFRVFSQIITQSNLSHRYRLLCRYVLNLGGNVPQQALRIIQIATQS